MNDGLQNIIAKRNQHDLWVAIENDDLQSILDLISNDVDVNAYSFNIYCDEEFPLLFAISLGRVSIAQALIQAGACIETLFIGSNPLHYAILNEQSEIAIALVQAGANKEILYRDMSPLHHAIKKGLFDVVKALVAVGANKELLYREMTSLHHAISLYEIEIAEFLIMHGADKEALYKGTTPLDNTIFTNQLELAQILVQAGADRTDCKFEWDFDTSKHYKIWFSKNPDEFLDSENQFRFVKLKAENPHITLTFIYSSHCLTAHAINELVDFCKAHNIIPLDFDTDLVNYLIDSNDLAIYDLAKAEIKHALTNQGGMLAAASDCLRLILPVIEKYGMYNDFEKNLHIKDKDLILSCTTPIILNFDWHSNKMSNDTIAVALADITTSILDPIAIKMIKNAQAALLSNYRDYAQAILCSNHIRRYCDLTKAVVKGYIEKYPAATLFDFRQFFLECTIADIMDLVNDQVYYQYMGNSRTDFALTTEQTAVCFGKQRLKNNYGDPLEAALRKINAIKKDILKTSVIAMSGPEIMFKLFQGRYLKYYRHCGRNENMTDIFLNERNNNSLQRNGSDLSWLSSGFQRKMERSANIMKDIVTIQSACRKVLAQTAYENSLKKRAFTS